MLLITVSRPGESLQFSDFERWQLPVPPGGADEEINGVLVLRFENEQEAIDYAASLQDMQNAADDRGTAKYAAVSLIINAIDDDEFIQSYLK